MQINAQFRDQSLSPTDFATVLNRLGAIIDSMADKHVDLVRSKWRLKGDSQEEASHYPVFDANEPSTAALSVLQEEFRTSPNQTYVAIWDGNETSVAGVNMVCHVGQPGKLNSFAIEMVGEHCVDDLDSVAHILMQAVHEFAPVYAEVSPAEYFEKRVFDDKPGVGWMLYLPKVITTQQVPEAHALIPVPEAGRKQTGTIIVSVTDAMFSVDNPEHVEIANRIEIRLVDQDLLPRYADI